MIKKTEPILFYLVVSILAMPVFCYDYFVTNDGPAHVYNANLIAHYFGAYHEHITALFNFNTSIEPNWIGHIILILFKLFASGAFSEKLLVASILFTFPVSVRNLVVTLNKENGLIAWLSIPFAFNFILGLGFYNFSIGIVILLFAINYSIKKTFEFKGKQLFTLLLYSVLLYFSHLIVYGLFLVFISLGILLKRNEPLKKLAIFTGIQLPLLLLSFLFLFNHSKGAGADALPFEVLMEWFLEARPLLIYNESLEAWFGYVINSIIIFILISGIIFSNLNKIKVTKNTHFLLFFIISFIMLLLFFIAPNELVSGGFLNIRMLLLFYLFFILLLSFYRFNQVMLVIPIIILMSITFYQQWYKFSQIRVMSADAAEMTSVVKHLNEGKTIIPLNYCHNWLHTNLSNYLAADKLMLLFDNYEANTVHFPLKWVPQAQPNPLLGNFSISLNPTFNVAPYENKTGLHIDYLLRWCYQQNQQDSISEKTNQEITRHFKLIFTSPNGNAELFERNN